MTKTLTRKAAMAQGAVVGFLAPRLAQDATIDLTPVFAGVTAANYIASRPAIILGVAKATSGKLAKDAKIDDLDKILMALDAAEPEEEKAVQGKGADKGARDRRGMDAMPEALREHMKGKMSAEDWKAACDAMEDFEGDESAAAEDEESEEDKKKREAEDKKARDKAAKDAETDKEKEKAEDKAAMDAAIKGAIKGERERQQAMRDAERLVRPWVGDIAIACDSADGVYETALKMLRVKTDGIHSSAYRAILEMQPRPGARNDSSSSRLAADSSDRATALKHAPGLARISIGA